MAKTKKKTATRRAVPQEYDGVYLLKLVLYVLLGSMWFKMSNGVNVEFGIPVGFIAGAIFASHEHFRIDRKIEYAILIVAMLIGYFAPYGLYISF